MSDLPIISATDLADADTLAAMDEACVRWGAFQLIDHGVDTGVIAASLEASEIGYIEDFALAKDRTKALERLIPGSQEYYYYHCLHHQTHRGCYAC